MAEGGEWLSRSMNVSEKAAVLSTRVPNNISKGGKGLIAHAVLRQVEIEEALACCARCLWKRGTLVQRTQVFSAEVDDLGSQTAKVFQGKFKGVHVVLNLITD